MSRTAAIYYHMRARRRERENESVYDGLVASPFDIGAAPFPVPANAEFAFSFSAGLDAGDVEIVFDGRTVTHPDLDADAVYKIGLVERGKEIEVTTLITGTFTLYIVTNNGVLREVANGSF